MFHRKRHHHGRGGGGGGGGAASGSRSNPGSPALHRSDASKHATLAQPSPSTSPPSPASLSHRHTSPVCSESVKLAQLLTTAPLMALTAADAHAADGLATSGGSLTGLFRRKKSPIDSRQLSSSFSGRHSLQHSPLVGVVTATSFHGPGPPKGGRLSAAGRSLSPLAVGNATHSGSCCSEPTSPTAAPSPSAAAVAAEEAEDSRQRRFSFTFFCH